MPTALACIAALLALCASAPAATIISVSALPNSAAAFVLLGADGLETVSWRQAGSFQNVDISVSLVSNSLPVSGIAYLTTRTGPGTTVADQVAVASFVTPVITDDIPPDNTPVFSGLSLGPGTYFLSVMTTGASTQAAWTITDTPDVVTGPGVSRNSDQFAELSLSNPGYPPAHEAIVSDRHLIYSVAAVADAVPEPGTAGLVVSGLFAALFLGARRLWIERKAAVAQPM